MLESPRGLRVIVLAAIVMCIVASLTGARGADEKAGLRVATVDLQKLQDEYEVIKSFRTNANKQDTDFKVEYETCLRNQLLSEEDQKTLVALAIKERAPGGLTKPEQDKQKTLLDQSKVLTEHFIKLQNTPAGAFAAADEAKLKEYTKLATETETRLKTHQSQLQKDVDGKAQETAANAQKSMKETLAKLARDKGYNLVLSSAVAPYAEYDCTEDVLKALNKK